MPVLIAAVQKHKTILLWQAALAILFVVCLFNPAVNYILKFYVDFFSASRTDFKLLFFITYIFFILTLRFIQNPPAFLHAHRWAIHSAVTLYTLGLVEHVWLFYRHFPGHPPSYFIYTLHDFAYSSSVLTHTHVSKVILGNIVYLLFGSSSLLKGYDIGAPYLTLLPQWLIAAHFLLFLCFILCIVLSLLCFKRVSRGLYAVYVMVAFITVRNSIDGGIFDFQTIAALPCFVTINYHLSKYTAPNERRCLGTCILISAIAAVGITVAVTISGMYYREYYLLRIEILFIIYCYVYLIFNKKSPRNERLKIFLAFLCSLMILTIYIVHSKNMPMGYKAVQYALARISGSFYVHTPRPLHMEALPYYLEIEYAKKITGVPYYIYRMKSSSPKLRYEVSRDLGIAITDHYISNLEDTWCQAGYSMKALVHVLASRTSNIATLHSIEPFGFIKAEKENNLLRITMHFTDCVGSAAPEGFFMYLLTAIGIRTAVVLFDG